MPEKETKKGFANIFGGKRAGDDPIHKLTRVELLELLVDQTREAETLKRENETLKEELARCRADLDRVASLEAVIQKLESLVSERADSQ
ncbi:MAG: hypothetical protein ACOX8R_02790 [Bacillota bacterium]